MTKLEVTAKKKDDVADAPNRTCLRACDIVQDSQFDRRDWRDDDHTRMLRTAITNGARLPPVVVWQDPDNAQGTYTLIDGAYRLAALAEAKGRNAMVRVEIFWGTRQAAYLRACEANAQHGKPLTENERMNAAWGLIMQPEPRLTQVAIIEKMGIGRTSVQTMWRLWREATEVGNIPTMTGRWKRDKLALSGRAMEIAEMTDEQREAKLQKMVKGIHKVWGIAAKNDMTLVAEATGLASNDALMGVIIEYNLPCGDDEEDIDDFGARARRFRAMRSSGTQRTLEGLSCDPHPDF